MQSMFKEECNHLRLTKVNSTLKKIHKFHRRSHPVDYGLNVYERLCFLYGERK